METRNVSRTGTRYFFFFLQLGNGERERIPFFFSISKEFSKHRPHRRCNISNIIAKRTVFTDFSYFFFNTPILEIFSRFRHWYCYNGRNDRV